MRDSIADSLRAPNARDYSFALASRYMDELGQVTDDQIRDAMRLILRELKMMVEPACAPEVWMGKLGRVCGLSFGCLAGWTATAAALGPLRERLQDKSVGVLLCGSNIDLATFQRLLA